MLLLVLSALLAFMAALLRSRARVAGNLVRKYTLGHKYLFFKGIVHYY